MRTSPPALAISVALAAKPTLAQVPPGPDAQAQLSDLYPDKSYSPYAGGKFPNRVLWGDTHLHTSASMDAGAFDNEYITQRAK